MLLTLAISASLILSAASCSRLSRCKNAVLNLLAVARSLRFPEADSDVSSAEALAAAESKGKVYFGTVCCCNRREKGSGSACLHLLPQGPRDSASVHRCCRSRNILGSVSAAARGEYFWLRLLPAIARATILKGETFQVRAPALLRKAKDFGLCLQLQNWKEKHSESPSCHK